MSPGIEPHGVGREMELLDPASNQIRFFQRGGLGKVDELA